MIIRRDQPVIEQVSDILTAAGKKVVKTDYFVSICQQSFAQV